MKQPGALAFSGRLQAIAAQAKAGVLSHMQPLAQVQQVREGCQVTAELHAAQQAAELHFLLLALRVAAPVEPTQVVGYQLNLGSLGAERGKVVLRCLPTQMYIEQQLVASRQCDEQVACSQLLGAHGFALHLQAQGGVKVQRCLLAKYPRGRQEGGCF